jgi:hypothetical protein
MNLQDSQKAKRNRSRKMTHGSIVMLFVTVFLALPCFALDDGDFQFWGTAGASCDINKDWKVRFDEELRYGDDASELYYHHSDLGFIYSSLAEWIDLGFNYRQVFEKDSAGKWR